MSFAGEFLGLPGLRGYWPMGAFNASGDAIDQSGNARTLTYTGNPTYNYHASGGPYIDLDGTDDYLARADEAGLDIIGTESYVATAVRGLTLGGWFWFDSLAAATTFYGKRGGTPGSGFSYFLQYSGGVMNFHVSSNGTALTSVAPSFSTTGQWVFICGRYTPSVELAIFINSTETDNTTSIPASIANVTGAFQVGGFTGANEPMNGRAGMCFLCATILSDTAISNLYNNTKASYGL